jgi:SNF2 family DNA or RNA helicase
MKNLHHYQHKAIDFIQKKKKCALYLDMGLGKTIISLTAIQKLLDEFTISKVLIIGPLHVVNNVWHKEIIKWDHIKHLTWSIITGNEDERIKALNAKVDIYLINRENVLWLYGTNRVNWDMIIVDESHSFKNSTSKRFKALKKFKYEYMVHLSGTPSPNSLLDLWSQIYLLDNGERLGKTMCEYKHCYFISDYLGYNFTPRKVEDIYTAISDLTLSMKSEDYIELPECIKLITEVDLSSRDRNKYNELERDYIVTIKNTEITTFNAAALTNKLFQFCNGAVYDESKNVIEIHEEKLNALNDIIEENPNENIIVIYNFQSDLKRLLKRFKNSIVMDKTGVNATKWNNGEIKLLLCQPASCSEGLNLQQGGRIIIWFGLTWSLKNYQQMNKRLYRQGQLKPVVINHIVVKNCMDEKIIKRLEDKNLTQASLLEALSGENL